MVGIVIQQYCPLAQSDGRLMKNAELGRMARKYGRSVAQVALRWGVQHKFSAIPKSRREK